MKVDNSRQQHPSNNIQFIDMSLQSSFDPLCKLGDDSPCDYSASLPPLDLVTLSSHCDEDDTSVSTLSSREEDDIMIIKEEKPRALFPSYWNKSGGRSRKPVSPLAEFSCDASSAANTYERSLQETAPKHPVSPRRRRLFDFSESTPVLSPSPFENNRNIRKATSAPALPNARPKASCLRPSRYSGKQLRQSDETTSEVSFNPEVAVLVFERPCEQYAANGWSVLFS